MKLWDLFTPNELDDAISACHIRQRVHPTEPLSILNYTERCQFEHAWTHVTRQCRGLIYDIGSLNVVARPWSKFFNYGEHPEGSLDPAAHVRVFNKLDGSLGILYPSAGSWAIATRGSFESDQALKGTELLQAFLPKWSPDPTRTYLFEIIYPENRIVVDYGSAEELVLLDVLVTETGEQAFDFEWTYPGGWVEEFGEETIAEALALPPRTNAEGLVLFLEDGLRVKLKQDDYVELHRLITGLTERRVWEALGGGQTVEEICELLPEEFWPWVENVANDLRDRAASLNEKTCADFNDIIIKIATFADCAHRDWTRKDFALEAVKRSSSSLLFSLLDDKSIDNAIWKSIRPEPGLGPRAFSEDTA